VAEHYPGFRDRRAAEERPLPPYAEDEFEAYLKCGLLEHGFLRVKCESCATNGTRAVYAIVDIMSVGFSAVCSLRFGT
jgi:hypothetical protein